MKQYPDPISLPSSIYQAREKRNRQIVRSVAWGASIRALIIAGELAGVFWFGSSALLMDALSSLVDVVCSLFLIIFIKLADRPPDRNHPFGHGRFEPLAGLQLGLLLSLIGGGMLLQQIFQVTTSPQGTAMSPVAWMIPFGAMILLEIGHAIVMRAAKNQDSPALLADAAHYRIDSLTSLFAALALISAAYFPEWSFFFDHGGAILIAILMVFLGFYAVRDNLHQLLDRIPATHYFDTVKQAARRVKGVFGTEKIRIQLYGPDSHVDIDIEVEPEMSVLAAHEISQQVRVEIQKDWPAVRDVTVHIEPFYPNDHI